ncbi:MAG: hypothetical protein H0W68_04830 [Gemmatimonadaceae bacterium]|nr:hypothetical protein [Gemmatimonadaceae bacterium]
MKRFEPSLAPNVAVPVLLLASGSAVRSVQLALGTKVALTVTDEVGRARALAATGGFVAIVAFSPFAASMREAVAIDPGLDAKAIEAVVTSAIERTRKAKDDPIAALAYNEYIELARYGITRRYLIALLERYGGSVTDAARGANMKRESLHRLMRRHHLIADNFRDS